MENPRFSNLRKSFRYWAYASLGICILKKEQCC